MVHMVAVSESAARGLPVAPGAGEEWTVDLLELLPDDGLRYEIIDGVLIVSPSPVPRHQRAIRRLCRIFEDNCPDDHEVFSLHWTGNLTSARPWNPTCWSWRRTGSVKRTSSENPAIVVEVLSPSTSRYDRVLQFSRYAE